MSNKKNPEIEKRLRPSTAGLISAISKTNILENFEKSTLLMNNF